LEKEFVKDVIERLCTRVNEVLTQQPPNKLNQHLRPACSMLMYSNETISLCQGFEGPQMRSLLKVFDIVFMADFCSGVFYCLYLSNEILLYLQAQLAMIRDSGGPQDWPIDYLRKFVITVTCWVETVSFQTQPEEDVKEILLEIMPFLDEVQPLFAPQDQFHIMKVVHALLRTRCIVLLQNIYFWVVNKLNAEPDANSNVEGHVLKFSKDADLVLLVLAYLSDIGNFI